MNQNANPQLVEAVSPDVGVPIGDARRGKVARSALHLVSGQVATTILAIVLNSQLGRSLGAGDFGLYFFLLTSTYFANVFIEWGQGIVLVRDVAQRPERTPWLLGSAGIIRLVVGLPIAFLAALVLWVLDYDARTQGLMVLTVLAWIPTALLQLVGLVFRGHERMDLDARATVIGKVIHVATVVVALQLGGRLVAVILSLGASGVVAFAWAVRRVRDIEIRPPAVDFETVARLLSDGAPVLFLAVLGQAQIYIETLMLSSMVAKEVLGWYGAARSITSTLIMPAPILVTATLPALARALRDPLALRRDLGSSLRFVMIVGACVAGGTALFSGVAIGLIYGVEAYAPSGTLLGLMAPALLLLFINILLGSVVILLGRTTAVAAIRVAVIGLCALLAWWSIPWAEERWGNGAIGALGASTLGEILLLIGFLRLIPRGGIGGRAWFDLLRALLGAGVGAAVVLLAPSNPFLSIPLFLLVFAGVAMATRLVGKEDVEALRAALQRRAKRV